MENTDPKAWVRQWISIIMSIYVCSMGIMATTGLIVISMGEFGALTAPAWGIIGWFFRARDIEKKQANEK